MDDDTRTKSLLGPDGRPVRVSTLTEEQAAPTLTGVRSSWHNSVSGRIDPQRLAQIIREANEGDGRAFLSLAEEMEERDAHYASVLSQRKLAVAGITPVVNAPAGADGPKAKAAIDAVEALVAAPIFEGLVSDLLDGLAKGYSVVEPEWRFGDLWAPIGYAHRDPRHFRFDPMGRELRIRDDAYPDGRPIEPHSMIVHRPRLKTGLTVRSGLARVVSWSFMLKTFALQDWAAFLEVFGMPLRVGRYDKQASAEERRVLLRAVRNLGPDASAIIPKGMDIEFIEVKGGGGNAVFGAMADYLDKQVSKAVIGQTMTADEGSSKAQSQTHDEVRGDIRRSDARQLGTTVNEHVATFVSFNFGPDVPPPTVSFPVEDAEDQKILAETTKVYVDLGLPIAQKDAAKRAGYRIPDPGEPLLKPMVAGQLAAQRHACPGCGTTRRELASAVDDPLLDELMDGWEADVRPILDQVMEAARRAGGFEAFAAELAKIDPDTGAMARRMAIAAMKARGDGDVGDG
ncbi:MAG: DUF935 domain-containing protein [Paracoccaceae bacterium]